VKYTGYGKFDRAFSRFKLALKKPIQQNTIKGLTDYDHKDYNNHKETRVSYTTSTRFICLQRCESHSFLVRRVAVLFSFLYDAAIKNINLRSADYAMPVSAANTAKSPTV